MTRPPSALSLILFFCSLDFDLIRYGLGLAIDGDRNRLADDNAAAILANRMFVAFSQFKRKLTRHRIEATPAHAVLDWNNCNAPFRWSHAIIYREMVRLNVFKQFFPPRHQLLFFFLSICQQFIERGFSFIEFSFHFGKVLRQLLLIYPKLLKLNAHARNAFHTRVKAALRIFELECNRIVFPRRFDFELLRFIAFNFFAQVCNVAREGPRIRFHLANIAACLVKLPALVGYLGTQFIDSIR